jgi:cytochrome b pre-mRNA-processing protein 3
MIAKLFRRLTADPGEGGALFDWVTRTARDPDWYRTGAVPDTIDGRFAMLATIAALACLRLEQLGAEGERLSIALTERFAEVMESEHRELGLGDPTLGKTVLRLVGGLERRIDALRPAVEGGSGWAEAASAALPATDSSEINGWRAGQLERIAERLERARVNELARGAIP